MSQVDSYVRAFDESVDYATSHANEIKQTALEDIDDLLRERDRRDVALWSELDVDAGATVEDYETDDDRDLDWILGLAAMGAAALTQFVTHNARFLIVEPVAYMEQVLDPFDMDRDAMIAAGRRGAVGTAKTATRFQALEARYMERLEYIAAMDPVDLYRTLRGFGGLPAIEKTTADAMGYASRLTNYAAGSPQFRGAASDLVNGLGGRALKAQTRRAIERIHTEREARGNRFQLLVWLCEGGKATCDFCLDRGGEIATYEQWITDGLPGADVCAGLDLCNCRLAAV